MTLINDLKKVSKKQWIVFFGLSAVFYVGLLLLFHGKQVGIHYILDSLKSHEKTFGEICSEYFRSLGDGFSGYYGEQRKIVFIILQLILAVIVFTPKKFTNMLWKHRFVAAFLFMAFVTFNKYHGDSMGAYHSFVQPGTGDLLCNPLYGKVRYIRSDEWAVATPAKISASYGEHPYGQYNEILRGGDTVNSINGVFIGYSTLGKNFLLYAFPLLGVERGFSFMWWGQIVLTFLVSLEFFYIVSRRKRLPALTGAMLITFSSFYMWWAFPVILWTSQGALVCFYYVINSEGIKKKLPYAFGFGVCFASFCTMLYPAWQVPFGYVSIALAIWMIHDNFDRIKAFKKKDYLVVAGMAIFAGTLVAAYLHDNIEYIRSIAKTVYPGNRISTGGFNISKVFYYVQAPFYPYKDIGLTSEYSCFVSLFPLPIIIAAIKWFKNKKNNWYAAGLLVSSIPLTLYCLTGLPRIICKMTLMSKTTTVRVEDAIGYICVLLIVDILARDTAVEKVVDKKITIAAIASSIATVAVAIVISYKVFSFYWNTGMMILAAVMYMPVAYGLIAEHSEKLKNLAMYMLIVICLITGIAVRPIMKGFYPIWSKPVAHEIMKITKSESDAKWLGSGESMVYQAYLAACGAKCENTTNFYPDMDFWHTIDPDEKYEKVYNRYAHVVVAFTDGETTMENGAQDTVRLTLSYSDLEKLGISYIFTDRELHSDNISLTLIYNEYGAYIYAVN